MAEQVIVNKQGVLQWRDIAKSWLMIVILPAIQGVIELFRSNGSFEGIEWDNILISTAVATLLFLAQRLAEPNKVITVYDTKEEAETVASEIKSQQAV